MVDKSTCAHTHTTRTHVTSFHITSRTTNTARSHLLLPLPPIRSIRSPRTTSRPMPVSLSLCSLRAIFLVSSQSAFKRTQLHTTPMRSNTVRVGWGMVQHQFRLTYSTHTQCMYVAMCVTSCRAILLYDCDNESGKCVSPTHTSFIMLCTNYFYSHM